MKKPVYVIGHKNPDTDSIVSAIAYAEYKKKQGCNAIAARIGSTNNETEYLLEKFGFEDPIRLYTARSLLKEIDIDKAKLVSKDLTMKEALDLALGSKNRSLVVVDKKKHLEGIVSLDDLTYMWTLSDDELKEIIKTIKLDDTLRVLKAKVVCESNHQLSGLMHMFPSLKSRVYEGSIVLLRNESEKIEYCINKGAKLLVIITSSPIEKKIIKLASQNNASIIVTELSPLTVTRLIYQTPTIEQVMQKDIEYYREDETVQEVSKKLANSRHRSYPVVDDDNKVVGSVSRYHLFNYVKKKFILVDHNEYKQTIDEIDDGEIVEIVDHHRIGGFEADNPINIVTKNVGATATIIASMYLENNVKLTKKMAGLLLGAIISDTMNFKSPTTTSIDKDMAKKLEKIAGIKADTLSKGMIEHADSLLSKRLIEIVFNDFKEFNIDGTKVGLAQSLCKSKNEFEALKDGLKDYIEDSCKSASYDVLIIMLTNPNGSGSYVLAGGNKSYILDDIYGNKIANNFVKGLVSRKKQLLPAVIKAISSK